MDLVSHPWRDARAIAVVDLGFGDAGKGLVVDHLVQSLGAALVVRFNGGAQAGHNVVTADGRHHTFSQFGSGSFVAGVRTHLSRHVVVHPTAALVEAARLEQRGVRDALGRLSVSPDALIVTPFHQAIGRLREIARGDARHGSCGVGVGETVRDAIEAPKDALRAGQLRDPQRARSLLLRARERLARHISATTTDVRRNAEHEILEAPEVIDSWLKSAEDFAERVSLVDDASLLQSTPGRIVFEGAQGVLLDETRGFHPFTTWSNCTFDNASELAGLMNASLFRLGVARSYAHRHGPGPLPTETEVLETVVRERHNRDDVWQGKFRTGWPDLVLARYARRAVGDLDAVALTHVDVTEAAPHWKMCTRYEDRGTSFEVIEPGADLEAQTAITRRLLDVTPIYENVRGMMGDRARACRAALSQAFSAPIVIESRGPTAAHCVQLPR